MSSAAAPNLDLLNELYRALRAQYGTLLSVGDVDRAKARFRETIKRSMDPDLSVLRFREAPPTIEGGNLMIYKIGPQAPQSTIPEDFR